MTILNTVDRSIAPVVQGLNSRANRHAAIASNIANADTPGYRGVDVSFGGALERAGMRLTATHPLHRPGSGMGGADRVVLSGGEPRRDDDGSRLAPHAERLMR